ncbi:MAG: hypothetical protein JRN59_06255 [Nitrososphaerota archaeon]|nr:hypothetical protein [Nitrososphaerota archaeon]
MASPTSSDVHDERFVAGFILNKLYLDRCYARRKSHKHGKHIQLSRLPTGLPPGKGDALSVARRLDERLIKIFKANPDEHVCALIDNDAVEVGLPICNYYRERVGLPPLNRRFQEMAMGGGGPGEGGGDMRDERYRRLTEKEKRNREYLEKVKKWMGDSAAVSQPS